MVVFASLLCFRLSRLSRVGDTHSSRSCLACRAPTFSSGKERDLSVVFEGNPVECVQNELAEIVYVWPYRLVSGLTSSGRKQVVVNHSVVCLRTREYELQFYSHRTSVQLKVEV